MADGKRKGFIAEFQEFISRGSVIDMAVGVIVGGAFTSVVNSLVKDIFQPLLNSIGGSPEIKGLTIYLNGQAIDFGAFISAIISFLITALAVFLIVKIVNRAARIQKLAAERAGLAVLAERDAKPKPRKCPFCMSEIADNATRCPHCTSKLGGYHNANE